MKTAIINTILLTMLHLFSSAAIAESPVTFHASYDSFDFLNHDDVHHAGVASIDDRGLELVSGKFGKALHYSKADRINTDMSGSDLDMITTLVIDNFYYKSPDLLNKEPFFNAAGKLHPASGAVSFWVKGAADSASVFQLATSAWGRTEKELIEIVMESDGSLRAYVEDARYVRHEIVTKPLWKNDRWYHIVMNWDRKRGLDLWVNGEAAASNMGDDAWWENQRPSYMHFDLTLATYDELYCFSRILSDNEIASLYKKNIPPTEEKVQEPDRIENSRLKEAFISDSSTLPVLCPSIGTIPVVKNITPNRVHDDGILGWWVADGRYECAWPHEYTIFTRIPGDVDFVAEKVELLPPSGAEVNYITFEGNLDGVELYKGERDGGYEANASLTVPETNAFFHGSLIEDLGDSELKIPFTKSYGVPTEFFDSDILKLPLSGDLRIHEAGLFNVSERRVSEKAGDKKLLIMPESPEFKSPRYIKALSSLLPLSDRQTAGIYDTPASGKTASSIVMRPMEKLNLFTEIAVDKLATGFIAFDLWAKSPNNNSIIQIKLLNPAVPSQTWTHAEFSLESFDSGDALLRFALEFDPVCLAPGDRLWLQIMSTDTLEILCGGDSPSSITLRPAQDSYDAEQRFSRKTMMPNILTWGRMFEFIPWDHGDKMPDLDNPKMYGGPYDTAYPWQAVLRVNPGDRLANIYRSYSTGEYRMGRHPVDLSILKNRQFEAPDNAPDWAVSFREFQTFRNRIMAWWRYHIREDGQVGGGWNDDTLLFGKGRQGYGDLPLDSCDDALYIYNKIFDGLGSSGFYQDGYCRVWPIDQGHNGDIVRDRYKSIIYNLGDPQSAVWAMEEAWHWGKPQQTPRNYGDGSSFLFGLAAIEWYWNRHRVEEPYVADREKIFSTLRTAANVHNDTTYWRYSDAWNHIDDQRPYTGEIMPDMLNGGFGLVDYRVLKPEDTYITVGVGWPVGGGPELARFVEYSGCDGLSIDMYSFDSLDRKVTARLFRIDPGDYRITLSIDRDGDNEYESVISDETKALRRFDTIEITVPPHTNAKLTIKQITVHNEAAKLPDLALSHHFIKRDDNSLTATVYNIGLAESGPFTVTLKDSSGRVAASKQLASIPGAEGYTPHYCTVTFDDIVPDVSYLISADTSDDIFEIFEGNNSVEIAPSLQTTVSR